MRLKALIDRSKAQRRTRRRRVHLLRMSGWSRGVHHDVEAVVLGGSAPWWDRRYRYSRWPPPGCSRGAPRWPRTVQVDHHHVDGSMPCSAMTRCPAATGQKPPWTFGCRVLTRPSIISGKPVTSTPRSPAGRLRRAVGAAGGQQFDTHRLRALAKSTMPVCPRR